MSGAPRTRVRCFHRLPDTYSSLAVAFDKWWETLVSEISQKNIDLEKVSTSNTASVELVFCPLTSRLGSNARHALRNVKCADNVALLVFHPLAPHVTFNGHSDEVLLVDSEYKKLGAIFDVVMSPKLDIYDCPKNTESWDKFYKFIYRYKEEPYIVQHSETEKCPDYPYASPSGDSRDIVTRHQSTSGLSNYSGDTTTKCSSKYPSGGRDLDYPYARPSGDSRDIVTRHKSTSGLSNHSVDTTTKCSSSYPSGGRDRVKSINYVSAPDRPDLTDVENGVFKRIEETMEKDHNTKVKFRRTSRTGVDKKTKTIWLCLVSSRPDTNIDHILKDTEVNKNTAILIVHPSEPHVKYFRCTEEYPCKEKYKQTCTLIDIRLSFTQGFYSCDTNTKAIQKMAEFLKGD